MAARFRLDRRRRLRVENRRILFGDVSDSSESETSGMDSQAEDLPPYSTSYLVEYSHKHLDSLTLKAQQVLTEASQELLIHPSMMLSNRIAELEQLVPRLVQVGASFIAMSSIDHTNPNRAE